MNPPYLVADSYVCSPTESNYILFFLHYVFSELMYKCLRKPVHAAHHVEQIVFFSGSSVSPVLLLYLLFRFPVEHLSFCTRLLEISVCFYWNLKSQVKYKDLIFINTLILLSSVIK